LLEEKVPNPGKKKRADLFDHDGGGHSPVHQKKEKKNRQRRTSSPKMSRGNSEPFGRKGLV